MALRAATPMRSLFSARCSARKKPNSSPASTRLRPDRPAATATAKPKFSIKPRSTCSIATGSSPPASPSSIPTILPRPCSPKHSISTPLSSRKCANAPTPPRWKPGPACSTDSPRPKQPWPLRLPLPPPRKLSKYYGKPLDPPIASMMLSIMEREAVERAAEAPAGQAASENTDEFEIVLGPRHIASVLFVAIVILVAFSAFSYLVGKSASPKPALPEPTITVVSTPPPVVTKPETAPAPEPLQPAPVAAPASPAPSSASPSAPERSLFGDPKTGALSLQLGAVDKGVAILMSEGLRKRGFDSFVAPGPNDHIFRVLIGPLDSDSYKKAKDGVDAIGLSTFARKYQQ